MIKLAHNIGFIGAGNMGEAMIAGIVDAGMCGPEKIFFFDANPDRAKTLTQRYGIGSMGSSAALVERSDIIVFAVKPQVMKVVLSELGSAGVFSKLTKRKLLVSIAAGIRIAAFEDELYAGLDPRQQAILPILRAMPNTPALVRSGITGLCANHNATAEDTAMVRHLLSAVGGIVECAESEMDAVTAVSGSGPAYCFYLAEAMIEAGISLGFSHAVAATLTTKTLKGAAELLEKRNESPEILRKNVTSPGGTTEAAIRTLDDHGVKQALVSAVKAAARRSKELSA